MCKAIVLIMFLLLAFICIRVIFKKSTHSIMDSTTVSGAVGSGSIPDGCTDNISNLISEILAIFVHQRRTTKILIFDQ